MTGTRTVVPGEWYGVLGDDVIVLLPPEAKARVAGLWETVDDGAGFDEVLDALISDGLRSLPAFVLVTGDERDLKVVIRGAGTAELRTSDGPVTISGSADTTWVEQNVRGVTGLEVRVAEGTGEPYAVGTGLVRVAGVEHPARASAEPVVPPQAASAGLGDGEAVAVPMPMPEPVAPEPQPEPPRKILPPDPQLQPKPAPEPPVAAGAFDPLTSPDLAVRPDHARTYDDGGDTQAGGFGPAPTADPEPAASSRAVARLVFSNGEVVDVDRAVVIGRAPDHGRFGTDDQTRLVTVPSPHQEISSTHLEVRPGTGADHGSAVATDLGSTNGTVVAQPGLPAEDLRPGVAVALLPGAIIDLGEGVSIQVTRP